MLVEAAAAFSDALKALKTMHGECWVHTDIKPANIGIMGKKAPYRAVLLDTGSSVRFERGSMIALQGSELLMSGVPVVI